MSSDLEKGGTVWGRKVEETVTLAEEVDRLKEENARLRGENEAYKAMANRGCGGNCGCGAGGNGNIPWTPPSPYPYPYNQPQIWCGNSNGVTQL